MISATSYGCKALTWSTTLSVRACSAELRQALPNFAKVSLQSRACSHSKSHRTCRVFISRRSSSDVSTFPSHQYVLRIPAEALVIPMMWGMLRKCKAYKRGLSQSRAGELDDRSVLTWDGLYASCKLLFHQLAGHCRCHLLIRHGYLDHDGVICRCHTPYL